MRVRELSILLLVGLTLMAACGSDDNNKAGSKSTETITTSNPKTTASPTTTVPKVPFATGLPVVQQKLTAAKGDACKLYNFANDLSSISDPSSKAENKSAVELLAQYFQNIADVMEADHKSQAQDLRNETTKFTSQAEAADYKLDDPEVTALNDTAFQQAFTTFQQSASSCTTATTAPGA